MSTQTCCYGEVSEMARMVRIEPYLPLPHGVVARRCAYRRSQGDFRDCLRDPLIDATHLKAHRTGIAATLIFYRNQSVLALVRRRPNQFLDRRKPDAVVFDLLKIVEARVTGRIQSFTERVQVLRLRAAPFARIQTAHQGLNGCRRLGHAECTMAGAVYECPAIQFPVTVLRDDPVIPFNNVDCYCRISICVHAEHWNLGFTFICAPRYAPPFDRFRVRRDPGSLIDGPEVILEARTSLPIESTHRTLVILIPVVEQFFVVNARVPGQLAGSGKLEHEASLATQLPSRPRHK